MERKGTIQGWVLLKKHFQNRKLNQPVEKYTDSQTAVLGKERVQKRNDEFHTDIIGEVMLS